MAGLFYVKWHPYYDRAFVAAAGHSIGHSILMGDAASAPAPSWDAALAYALAYGKAIWQAMLLGLLLGSGIQALLPADWVRRVLGGHGFGGVVAGGLLAMPGMMCTCCAAPVVVGMRRHQAAPGPAMAFWLGNTVLNPATLVFTGFVLGWHWTLFRLCLGVPLVFGLGYLASRLAAGSDAASAVDLPAAEPEAHSLTEVGKRWLRIFARMTMRLLPEYLVIVLLLGGLPRLDVPGHRSGHRRPVVLDRRDGAGRHAVRDPDRRRSAHRAGDAGLGHGWRSGRRLAADLAAGQPAVAGDAGALVSAARAVGGGIGGGGLRRAGWRHRSVVTPGVGWGEPQANPNMASSKHIA
ncbi:permease [Dyella sp. 2RAB6]|uniref:permease n=1 Tax=Dyella sp. 2RAB6 TaxID=3232992 RepID=UPI003F92B373